MTRHDAGKKSTRQGTLARARRKNNEVDVDGRIALEHAHRRLIANNDVESMLARAEGNARELVCRQDHSLSVLEPNTS